MVLLNYKKNYALKIFFYHEKMKVLKIILNFIKVKIEGQICPRKYYNKKKKKWTNITYEFKYKN